jgi:integration host factor subunit alpha
MTKAELADKLQQRLSIQKKEAMSHVEAVLDLIKETLEQGEQVKIAGFGVFEIRDKNARRGRNPQTGESITIEPRRVLTFKTSAVLKEALNQGQA